MDTFALIILVLVAAAVCALLALPLTVYGLIRLGRSERTVADIAIRLRALEGAAAPPEAAVAEQPVPPPEPEPPTTEPVAEPVAPVEPTPRHTPEPLPPPPEERRPGFGFESIEKGLTARWFVWLGALALALGSAFLVKYSIDVGLLGPAVRTALGFVLGGVLVAAGEWLHRHPQARPVAGVHGDRIPPALVAAGVFASFASAYAAYGLYDLLSGPVAFVVLAAVALAGVALAPRHGAPVAILGTLGAFAVPLLVPSDDPNGWALFSYLSFVSAASLLIAWTQRWAWLGYVVQAPAALWVVAWSVAAALGEDALPAGLYALLSAVLVAATPYLTGAAGQGSLRFGGRYDPADWPNGLVWCALAAAGVLLFTVGAADEFGIGTVLLAVLFAGFTLLLAWRNPDFEPAPVVAAALAGAVALAFSPGTGPLPWVPHRVLDPDTVRYLTTIGGLGVVLAIGPYLLLASARRPSWLAGVSAIAPVALFAIAYARTEAFALSAEWALAALALAAIAVAAAAYAPLRNRDRSENDVVLGLFAAAATAATAIAIAVTLREAWLTAALAVEVLALAWIFRWTGARALRPLAAVLAAIVLVRLCLNPSLVAYRLGPLTFWNWLWYGYGVPAVALFAAARIFGGKPGDWLAILLDAGSVLLVTVLATLQVHVLVQGSLEAAPGGLLETALRTLVWLAIAVVLAWTPPALERVVARQGAVWLTGLSVAQIVLFHLGVENPLWTDEPVVGVAVVNLLLLAYGVPAVLLAAVLARLNPPVAFVRSVGGLVLVLAFVEVSLEVRRAFHGELLGLGPVTDLERYAYSAAWLVFGGVLLAGGILVRNQAARIGSLVVFLLAIAKVFLFDLAALTGLLRAVSFIGLGGVLIGVALFYQRVVFRSGSGPRDAGESTDAFDTL